MATFQEALRQKPDYLKARENLEQIVRIVNHHIDAYKIQGTEVEAQHRWLGWGKLV